MRSCRRIRRSRLRVPERLPTPLRQLGVGGDPQRARSDPRHRPAPVPRVGQPRGHLRCPGRDRRPPGQRREELGPRPQPRRRMASAGPAQPEARRHAVVRSALAPQMQHLRLHPRHVHSRRALPPARLAADAERQGLRHLVAVQPVGPQLPGHGEAQDVCPAPGRVHFLLGRPVGWAHHPRVRLSTGAVVVAELDGPVESAAGRPVHRQRQPPGPIAGTVAKERSVVHAPGRRDLPRVHHARRVEGPLDVLERRRQPLAQHGLDELGAQDAVAVLARVGAAQPPHHLVHFLGHGPQRRHSRRLLHVQGRSDVEAADGGVRVPSSAGAVAREDLFDRGGVLAEPFQRNCAVLHDGDRLRVPLDRHDHAQRGAPDAPHGVLPRRVFHSGNATPGAEPPHHHLQPVQGSRQRPRLVPGELDQQDRAGGRGRHRLHRGPERGVPPGQSEGRVVQQLHRVGRQLDERGHGVERVGQRGEPAHAQHPAGRHGRELELERAEERQGALRPDQQLGHRRPGAQEAVKVVAGHVTHHLGHPPLQLVGLPPRDSEDLGAEVGRGVGRRRTAPREGRDGVGRSSSGRGRVRRPEEGHPTVGQGGLHLQHVVGHDPVADRARAAAVVARHAAQRGAAGRGHVHREGEAARRQLSVQVVQHQPGLHRGRAGVGVHLQHAPQVARGVHHDGAPHRLPALGRSRSPGQHRRALLPRHGDRRVHVVQRAGQHHPQRLDLVDRRVGRVEPPRQGVEAHVARHMLAQARGQVVGACSGH